MSDLLNLKPDDDDQALTLADTTDASPPAATDTTPPVDEGPRLETPLLCGPVDEPEETSGWFMVLWAKVPDQGVEPAYRHRPHWQEVGYFKASSRDIARARAIEHDGRTPAPIPDRGPVARYLIDEARKQGIMLRAVAAEYWPSGVPVTTMYVPDPVLKLG